ncbi:MAG TPA: AAA family ATPase [Clostridia bacterium]|nr:AAA family ATPase [Clostridia bacterium]
MRKWMRDRMKRRKKPGKDPEKQSGTEQGPAPLQPTFLDREAGDWGSGEQTEARGKKKDEPQPEYEAQPETEPSDEAEAAEAALPTAQGASSRRDRSRRRGRRGRGNKPQAGEEQPRPILPIAPGLATGEASEVAMDDGAATADAQVPEQPKPAKEPKRARKPKGAVILAIGLPGSGKSSWFKRQNIIPLSSDLVRGLLFDDATEQRFQDLVFSTLRTMLRARLVASRPFNYIDATNLAPKERHSWIKMAQDFGYEAHAVYFDVPVEVCMERNNMRSRNVPDDVMRRMAQKLRPPKFEEGFAKITVVRLKRSEPETQKEEPGESEE